MADKKVFPKSQVPIRKSSDFLPNVFRTDTNQKFLSGVVDPLVQPGVVDKLVGYIGRRYGKTYNGKDIYLDSDATLRSRYQLEPGVTVEQDQEIKKFYDYLDLKNILKFFGNNIERDDKLNKQEHYSWNPPISWDKFTNYREYFWVPSGPPSIPVQGQASSVTSTYKVRTSIGSSWIFTPDGATNNPALTLYRGQTYKFEVNATEAFTIRTHYDTGSLIYNPDKAYRPGELVVFNGKLWKALTDISPDGSSIDTDSQDWELIDENADIDSLVYNNGITNNGVKRGTLTFEVPLDAPDMLFYQSDKDPNRLGRFIIADIDSNTFIDIEKEILGKKTYTSANGVEFTNGLVVEFLGQVESPKYAEGTWLVEGVGKEITLIKFSDLVPPALTSDTPEILFDNEGFDTQPFDDASQYPGYKDYITISRNSKDSNPWSRYNRWFHRSVLEYAYRRRGSDFDAAEASRAKRPIIEFHPNIKLYNHGTTAKTTVDYIDNFTTDVFSNVEGSLGYNIDGEFLFQGARVLVTADTDGLANNRIYEVNFITHNGRRQINLKETSDSNSVINECVLVRRGKLNAGKMYHFNGTNWVKSQEKTAINQSPLFDVFDSNGVSFSDEETYPVTTFLGTKILSYKEGSGRVDAELGFQLSYLNIDNVGDILFNWHLDSDSFQYTLQQDTINVNVSKGFIKINDSYDNGWIKTSYDFLQPIIDSVVVTETTNLIDFKTIDWSKTTSNLKIVFYVNGVKTDLTYTLQGSVFVFDKTFNEKDVVVIKVVDDVEPDNGYYEIPVGLEKNPLNEPVKEFTLGQAIDHVSTALEFNSDFSGSLPGVSNLRDISDYQVHAKRFLKHSGIAAASIALLNDKEINLVKSLQFSKKSYSVFKDNFIKKAAEIDFQNINADFVDDIITELTRTKTIDSPFADSDMIGAGAYTSIDYVVEDTGIKTFSLSQPFGLDTLSRRAVYVYKNNLQLLHGRDYEFNSTFGFIILKIDLVENDQIQIREYVSTAFSHIPPTPTSMGLYKKYTPMKFVDDTYTEPQEVIQGHDGSITIAYGDFRDDLLLELEYRIYNNIKQEYNPQVSDIDDIVGGYYENANYNQKDLTDIISQEFLKWVANTNLGYTVNSFFDSENPFTYTYSNMTDPTNSENLLGYWRGVYKYFYDTDRPHRCPWECLGFSEQPDWWESEYGPAPYTSGNLILWEDIRDGIIRHGERAGTYPRYARSSIMSHIPVNADGELIDPLTSGLAQNFTLINNKGSFRLGDIGPVEYAWRSSSEYPFAFVMALCLVKPFEFVIANFDRSKTVSNILDQIVDNETKTFLTISDLELPIAGQKLKSGLSFYVAAYAKSKGKPVSEAQDMLSNLNVRLSNRLSGFVDKDQQKYLLDSKNPNSTSSSTFIPPENYNIIFNVSSPISSLTYSGVILEKTTTGFVVNGYDDINPYFNYYPPIPNQKDPTISVGGVSASFVVWEENKTYNNGSIVEYRNDYWRANKTHTGTNEFDKNNWQKLAELPLEGAAVAQRRRNFNTTVIRRLSYGDEFNSIQGVVDFLLGYQEFLKANGFVFNNYDNRNQVVQDWTTSCKEFMFWTRHNWAVGSLITLSPGAEKLQIEIPVGVADNILNSFYDYNVLTGDGQPIDPKNIDVSRDFQKFVITTVDTTKGIYYLKLNYVLKEHVALFDDRTVFNDIIFDKSTGYRQERIKVQGFRTVDWDGDYTSPGFLFDNVQIATWSPFTNYKLGDIIAYRSGNYTSRYNHTSGELFDDEDWTILDSTPEKQLIANYDYRINQIEDYFDVASEGLGQSQRDLARHTVGYQKRDYLESLAEDPVTQFQLYQGFIREKGSNNAVTKLFNKLSGSGSASVELDEEWAFKVGTLGGTAQSKNIELKLQTDKFTINPQPVIITEEKGTFIDRYYRVNKSDFVYAPVPYTNNIHPTNYESAPFKTAGYVKLGQTDYIIKTKEQLTSIAVTSLIDNDHIWVTFNGPSWTVLRTNIAYDLPISTVTVDNLSVTIGFTKRHNLEVDDYIGLKGIDTKIDGVWKITSADSFSLVVTVTERPTNVEFVESQLSYPFVFAEARFSDYESITPEHLALLQNGSKLWIDNNGTDKWEVVEKNKSYSAKEITTYGLQDPSRAGQKVVYSDILKQTLVGLPDNGYVISYVETSAGLGLRQILEPNSDFVDATVGTFGDEIAISPDSKWLAVGSPIASGVTSYYQGSFDPTATYAPNDIVLHDGKLWKAKVAVVGDGSTINVYSDDWEYVRNISASSSGTDSGFTYQGMITLYEWAANQWNLRYNFISPRPAYDERFGHKIQIAKNGDQYHMAVSAPGSLFGKGRVYLYTYTVSDGWQLDENENYKGPYDNDPSKFYPVNSIVFYDGKLWKAVTDTYGDGSTISIDSEAWIQLDRVSTSASLPQSIALDDDGSSLYAGLLTPDQVAEIVMEGFEFGTTLSMNYDGSVLAVGAPEADGQYFPNYKGIWKPDYEYIQGDVVKWEDRYHILANIGADPVADGSTIRSYNQVPSSGYPWVDHGDSTADISGKVYIYRRANAGYYELIQTVTADSLTDYSDIGTQDIATGDRFGHALALDYSGSVLVVSSPKADINFQNQGTAYVFEYDTDSTYKHYRIKQKLQSYDRFPNEYFGQDVCISPNSELIAVGANNSPFVLPAVFDSGETGFDDGKTTFKSYSGFAGSVYVFERKSTQYFLAEKLEANLSLNESFGHSISCTSDVIVVGSPDYIAPADHGIELAFEGPKVGMARMFKKSSTEKPLTVLGSQPATVDIEQLKRLALYDVDTDTKLQDVEIIDPAKMKILASAERELSFKVPYDPAVYTEGLDDGTTIVDPSIAWTTKNVGKLWWNISTAKWIDYEQGDIAYRTANWGKLAEGSTIDIYEWVESKFRPSEWAAVADTNEGLQAGISGQPLYPEDNVYSEKVLLNTNTGLPTETLYYFWVRNKLIAPDGVVGRSLSASSVSSLISDPGSVGTVYAAFIDSNKTLFYNYKSLVNSDYAILNAEYFNDKKSKNAIHNEYKLITEGVSDSLPPSQLENKWIDSLIGYDVQGNRIPDTNLPTKQKYGINYRPRQSMFVNKRNILKIVINNINTVLRKQAFADIIDYTTLNQIDEQPSEILKLYDTAVTNYIDLETVGTIRVRKAEIRANIIDGEINSIDVINPGFGYKIPPPIEFEGDGIGAEAVAVLDTQGRVSRINIVNSGRKYSYVIAKIREFSVLVETDSTANNNWSIYAWDDQRKSFYRSRSQAFNTTRYWSKVDWWKEGYSSSDRIVKEINSVYQEPAISVQVGDIIQIKEYGSGGWAVFKKIDDSGNTLLENYELVGRKNGTIQFSDLLYDTNTSGIGYDIVDSFDAGLYDKEVANELRNILKAVKEDIFVGDYAVEWNKLFFTCIRYVFTEQTYVDWAFKTSFLNATHDVGELRQRVNYKSDGLTYFLDYINEVKPYRTTVREYVSKYNKVDVSDTSVTDFDLPPAYSEIEGRITTVSENNELIQSYPYKYWLDNKGYSITDIVVSATGSGYTSPPVVAIIGDGTGAKAKAYISNGKVSGVLVTDPGSGYTKTPTVTLVGGNGSNTNKAKAVPILGSSKSRSFNLKMKFDRITKEGLYALYSYEQTFTATGTSAVFELNYPSTVDKSKIQIIRNGQLVLNNEYSVSLYKRSTDGFEQLKGKITFVQAPDAGDVIKITYEKNDEILDSVNRIRKYYAPSSGMKGTDLDQLMTGIDFGGVQVQGTTFDVTGGWDALPWFTDSWDSVEAAADYYVVCDGSTQVVALPYVPTDGQIITIYLRREGTEELPTIDQLQYSEGRPLPRTIRIDDPNYTDAWDSSNQTNPHAQMPTFVGDGSTNTIEIGRYISTNTGDILIFRPVESDGSVTITDPNLVDTAITGGSLSQIDGAYATATGITAEEIVIEGGKFVSPDQVPATEENIPGQVLDSLSIKVYQTTGTGAAPIQSKVLYSDGTTLLYGVGQNIVENNSVIIYVDGQKVEPINYVVNVNDNSIEFNSAPPLGQFIEILSVGIGGVQILDYQEFIADGDTNLFLTNASFTNTSSIYVTLNGVREDVGFINSTGVVDTPDRTLVQFGTTPARNDVIKILTFAASTDVDSTDVPIVRINRQEVEYDGSTRNIDLDNFVQLTRESAMSSIIVEVNDVKLIGVDTIYDVYDGTNLNFTLGLDPAEASGAILTNNIRVYLNGNLQTFIQDYVYNGTTKELTINASSISVGDVIKIENDLRSQYAVVGDNVVINPTVPLTSGDKIYITWFGEYPSLSIVSDRVKGGKVVYELPFVPLSTSYVWVYKNGQRLKQDVDYEVQLPRGVVKLNVESSDADEITITSFGKELYRLPSAFEINKDMLNVYRYNRYSANVDVKLAKNLMYYDTSITVTDGSLLAEPIRSRNIPGIVLINNERIEYMVKTGNVLTQLRRGSFGTAIAETHISGSLVIDVGAPEALPYNDSQERTDFVSDGSSLLIGPLDFVPPQSTTGTWYAGSIPSEYRRCDTVEVFAGGKRLRKTSLTVFDETLSANSPGADREIPAEFAVNGTDPYIRLTSALPAGTRIRIIRKLGQTWYDRGAATATSGVTLLENESAITKFIAAKSTRLPE
jgi:hypothetical protein